MIRGCCVVTGRTTATLVGTPALTAEDWPEVFASRPMIGDWVKSKSGLRLQVVSVIHSTESGAMEPEPVIEVELA